MIVSILRVEGSRLGVARAHVRQKGNHDLLIGQTGTTTSSASVSSRAAAAAAAAVVVPAAATTAAIRTTAASASASSAIVAGASTSSGHGRGRSHNTKARVRLVKFWPSRGKVQVQSGPLALCVALQCFTLHLQIAKFGYAL